MKEIDNDSSVNASSFWYSGKKTYQLFRQLLQQRQNSCGGITQNEGKIVFFLLIYKYSFSEEQIKAHQDFFARRYNIDTWKIFIRTVHKIERLIQPWWCVMKQRRDLEFHTVYPVKFLKYVENQCKWLWTSQIESCVKCIWTSQGCLCEIQTSRNPLYTTTHVCFNVDLSTCGPLHSRVFLRFDWLAFTT